MTGPEGSSCVMVLRPRGGARVGEVKAGNAVACGGTAGMARRVMGRGMPAMEPIKVLLARHHVLHYGRCVLPCAALHYFAPPPLPPPPSPPLPPTPPFPPPAGMFIVNRLLTQLRPQLRLRDTLALFPTTAKNRFQVRRRGPAAGGGEGGYMPEPHERVYYIQTRSRSQIALGGWRTAGWGQAGERLGARGEQSGSQAARGCAALPTPRALRRAG